MAGFSKMSADGGVTVPEAIRTGLGIQDGDLIRFRLTGPATFEAMVITRSTLAEMLRRFRIEGPIDVATAREQWEAEAAEEVIQKALDVVDGIVGAERPAAAAGHPHERTA